MEASENNFDKEIRLFLSRCREIIKAHPGCQGEHPALICLNKYYDIYVKSWQDPQHKFYFETFFNRNRSAVLGLPQADDWLKGAHYIQYGEGTDRAASCRQYRIMIGFIYRMACEVRDLALDKLDSTGTTDQATLVGHDLFYPEIFLLHLTKVLACVCADADRARLLQIVGSLRRTLRGEPAEAEVASGPAASSAASPAPAFDMNSLFSSLQTVLSGQGVVNAGQAQPPAPGAPDIGNLFGNISNNPAIQKAFGNITQQFSQGKNFGEIASVAMQEIQSPEIMECVQRTISDPQTTSLLQQFTSTPELNALMGANFGQGGNATPALTSRPPGPPFLPPDSDDEIRGESI